MGPFKFAIVVSTALDFGLGWISYFQFFGCFSKIKIVAIKLHIIKLFDVKFAIKMIIFKIALNIEFTRVRNLQNFPLSRKP